MMIESCSSNSMFQETNSTNNTSRLKKYLRKMDQNLLLTTGSPCFYSFCQSRTWVFVKIQRGCCLYITLSNVLFKSFNVLVGCFPFGHFNFVTLRKHKSLQYLKKSSQYQDNQENSKNKQKRPHVSSHTLLGPNQFSQSRSIF